ncbi:MAG: autotransporter domain-containing protein [Steroidobacteraceae bacterium]
MRTIPAHLVLFFVLVLGLATEASAQVCSQAGATTTCNVGDNVAPAYATPTTETLILAGGGVAGQTPVITGPLELNNPFGAYDLILNTTGFVEFAPINNVAPQIVLIRNTNGAITSTWSANTSLSATETAKGIDAWSSSAGNIVNVLSFSGQLSIANVAATALTTGIIMRTDAGGDATTLLLAPGTISVTGGDAYGVVAYTSGGGDARTEVHGNVTTLAVGNDGIIAGALAYTPNGGRALLEVSGTITMDNRPFAANVDSFAAFARAGFNNGLARTLLSGTLETWGIHSGGARAYQEDLGDAEVETTSTSTVITHGDNSDAVGAVANGGVARVLAAGTLRTFGNVSYGIYAQSLTRTATVDTTDATILTSGDDSHGVAVYAQDGFTITTGDISTTGNLSRGIEAVTPGSADIDATGGAIRTIEFNSHGIRVEAGTALTLSAGDVSTTGLRANGVVAHLTTAGATSIDTSAGRIETSGDESQGIGVESVAGTVRVVAGDIDTAGADSPGILVDAPDDTTIDTTAALITTTGLRSPGVWARGMGTGERDLQLGAITTSGANNEAALVDSRGGDINVVASGALEVTGQGARAIAANALEVAGASGDVAVQVLSGAHAMGEWGASVSARSAFGSVSASVGNAGVLIGGWDSTSSSVNPATGFGSAALILNGGTGQAVSLTNAGNIGALSDRAVISTLGLGLQVRNAGVLTGYLELGADAELFDNSGKWNLRHFADTNGDGVRDVERVARTEFAGGIDVVENEATGTLLLGNASSAGSVDASFAYVPAGVNAAFHAITTAGVEQGQLLQLERFENRGTISLADADSGGTATAGDVLLITSGSVNSAGLFTAGTAPGLFVSDGGSLRLDTVLNAGGASSQSDLLVVDATAVGPLGPTRIFITQAGGLGAQTVGNGIKLVDVLNGPAVSAMNAFLLGANVMAGPFSYQLFRSGPLGDDGDWYLRTQLDPTPPVDPNPPGQPTVPVTPVPPVPPGTPVPPAPPGPGPTTFRPEAALLASLPNQLRNYDLAALATHHRRVGEGSDIDLASERRRARSWARALSSSFDTQQEGVLAPATLSTFTGAQIGFELLDGGLIPSGMPSLGVYAGRLTGSADVAGFAEGISGAAVGTTDTTDTFFALYGTHRRRSGLYFDYVIQRSLYSGSILAVNGTSVDLEGSGLLMSFEMGKALRLFTRYRLEPQLQLIAQTQKLDTVAIPNATVEQRAPVTLTGRLGLRFSGKFGALGGSLQPYLRASVWKGAPVSDQTRYSAGGGTTELDTDSDTTSAEAGAGLSWGFSRRMLVYAEVSKLFALQDATSSLESGSAPTASLGLRVSW